MRLKHLRIALASLAELGYGLHLARKLGYLSDERNKQFEELLARTAAPLHGLVRHIRRELSSTDG